MDLQSQLNTLERDNHKTKKIEGEFFLRNGFFAVVQNAEAEGNAIQHSVP